MMNMIAAIEEKLQAQKDEIFFKELQIEELKKELNAAESEIKNMRDSRGTAAADETIIKDSSSVVISNGKKYRLVIEDVEAGTELAECFAACITDEVILNILDVFKRGRV